ncbi:uncharacterized protein YeaO (DUF488 family) [Halospina denitrificans]|uniref:Uncharacterized protein YeaO (DUF488 family) n=1 Tax=Halospina denitrificans TaxID=332522 RepID=A0A4R7JKS9_9GAMM|nr:DUF488 domain-containing protein [Halospina denitrificans]TDT37687.1 uncharacterized protein YeaO (DUF488 family) [Halospina denitrificans]
MSDRIQIKRIYDPVETGDGYRVLVDRVWPRGVRKADAALDEWMKDLAPSRELRQWFGHDPERWEGFRDAYRAELAEHPQLLEALLDRLRSQTVTLLFSARDRAHNQAVVLGEVLEAELAEEQRPNEASSPVCYATDDWPQGGQSI